MTDEDPMRKGFMQTYPVLEWTEDGMVVASETPIISEYRIKVELDGTTCAILMCTPGQDAEMVMGHLFTEGFIDDAQDVASLEFEIAGECLTLARVRLANFPGELREAEGVEVPTTGSGSQVLRRCRKRPSPETYLTAGEYASWNARDVFKLDSLFSKDSPLHRLTSGTHSCYLMRDGELICCVEDIGRHNTVDKAIGWTMIHGIDRTQVIAFISGRVPTDMMVKAVRARFGVFATRKLPTREAIDMARRYRCTLVGDVAKGRLKVFSGLQPQDCFCDLP